MPATWRVLKEPVTDTYVEFGLLLAIFYHKIKLKLLFSTNMMKIL